VVSESMNGLDGTEHRRTTGAGGRQQGARVQL